MTTKEEIKNLNTEYFVVICKGKYYKRNSTFSEGLENVVKLQNLETCKDIARYKAKGKASIIKISVKAEEVKY